MKALYRALLSVISIAVLLLLRGDKVLSCSPELPYDAERAVLFRPELSGETSLAAWYYNHRYVGQFYSDLNAEDSKKNCEEWGEVIGSNVSEGDVYIVQYQVEPDDFLYAFQYDDWNAYADNAFIAWLRKPQNEEFLKYMVFAKQVEFDQLYNTDPWGENIHAAGYQHLYASDALDRCDSTSVGFLKERYTFQALKIASTDIDSLAQDVKEKVVQYYDRFIAGNETIIAAWAYLYRGKLEEDENKRGAFFLQAFDKSEEKKGYVCQFLTHEVLDRLAATTTDAHALSVIHAIKTMKNPGPALDGIRKVYSYDKSSRYLPLLIAREVNKLEDWLLSPEILNFSGDWYKEKNVAKDKAYLRELNAFLANIQTRRNGLNELVNLARIHLYHMDHDFVSAKPLLETKFKSPGRFYKYQLEIEKTISLIYTSDLTTPKVQEQLHRHFVRLANNAPQNENDKAYDEYWYDDDYDKTEVSQLYMVLANQFRAKGKIALASLAFTKADLYTGNYHGFRDTKLEDCYWRISYLDKYGSAADIDTLLAFKHKEHKTGFEESLVPELWASDQMYLDLKGTILLRQKKYREALTVMNTIDDSFWVSTYDFRYYLPQRYIGSVGTLIPGPQDSVKRYSLPGKKFILQDIVALLDEESKAVTPRQKAKIWFTLGNAYYNISYPGKAWMMFSYGKSSREDFHYGDDWAFYSFFPNSTRYRQRYYLCADAIEMYSKALASAGEDKELAARCLLMLAVCERNASEFKSVFSGNRDIPPRNKYLDRFLKKYSATEVFGYAESECPDVVEYLSHYN